MAFPEAWTEFALITIETQAGTTSEFMAITETIDIAEGDYPGESIMSVAGGRLWKQSAQEDGEITLEMYPVQVALEDNGGLMQSWVGGNIDASEPLVSDITEIAGVDRPRTRFRVSVLWTNDPAVSSADGTTAANTESLRFVGSNLRITSHKAEFTDGIMKVTITFKLPAMDKPGTVRNFSWESGDDTALASVDTTHGAFS